MSESNNTAEPTIELPPYDVDNPRGWFEQVESIFAIHGITSQLKRYELVADNLPDHTAEMVHIYINTVPRKNPYRKLKMALLAWVEKPKYKFFLKFRRAHWRSNIDQLSALFENMTATDNTDSFPSCSYSQVDELPHLIEIFSIKESMGSRSRSPAPEGRSDCNRLR